VFSAIGICVHEAKAGANVTAQHRLRRLNRSAHPELDCIILRCKGKDLSIRRECHSTDPFGPNVAQVIVGHF
jgi:hypothetical protein